MYRDDIEGKKEASGGFSQYSGAENGVGFTGFFEEYG
jgi:hypothetical protein